MTWEFDDHPESRSWTHHRNYLTIVCTSPTLIQVERISTGVPMMVPLSPLFGTGARDSKRHSCAYRSSYN
ncbi:hypothetical protein PILCRDRAFT_740464 [Piloderma croceum F 1598]|uniref:Uncharacterized protein n=1 Tax=Piloderma croceum (strain F 1598) TaxID=765440 RepID=A0A0C3EXH5_PILCF|nr:hypothetical protein PILCRDRAFT_740464 [Piloderma croceum F 1598]